MKVLHLDIEGGQGGSSRSLRYLVQGLKKMNVDSEVWHAKSGPSVLANKKNNIRCMINKNIVSIIPLRRNNLKNMALMSLKFFRLPLLALEIKKKDIDILHLNYEGLLLLALILRLVGFKKKIIVHVRTPMPKNYFSFFFCRLFKFVDGVIFITKMEKKLFELASKLKFKNFIINHNPAPDLLKYKYKFRNKKSFFKAIFLGNIDQTKAPDRIIDLAKKTKNMGLPVKYYIYGKEKKTLFRKKNIINENSILDLINDNDLKKYVFYKGHTEKPELIINSSDIIIRPSRNGDCWGRDIIEGMSAGLLVIATGNEKVFLTHKHSGLLYKVWDANLIAKDLAVILKDKKLFLKYKEHAYQFAKKEFSISKHTIKTFSFFKKFI